MTFAIKVDWVAVSAVATAALAFATFAFVVAAFLQRKDMRASAAAATRAAQAAESSVQLQREMFSEQSRLSMYPPLSLDLAYTTNHAVFRLTNAGSLPALDVDVAAISLRWDDAEPREEYFRSIIKPEHADAVAALGTSDEGAFGVYDHAVYDVVPPGRAVTANFDFPDVPRQLNVLLQFRDMVGRNYQHLYLTIQSEQAGRYVGAIDVPELKEIERIELFPPTAAAESEMPRAVREDFYAVWVNSIPSGYLQGSRGEVEDRGSWEKV
jgi:hypothetical protein